MCAVNFVINARVFMAPYLPINGYTCIFDSFRMSSDISWHHMAIKDILAHNQYIMAKVVAVLSKSETTCIGKPHSNMPKLLQVTSEFPAQRASNAGNVSIWWRHHVKPWFMMSSSQSV